MAVVDRISDRGGPDGRAGLNVPQDFADFGIEGDEIAFHVAGENEMAGGGKIASPSGGEFLVLHLHIAGFRIDGADEAFLPLEKSVCSMVNKKS